MKSKANYVSKNKKDAKKRKKSYKKDAKARKEKKALKNNSPSLWTLFFYILIGWIINTES